MEEVKNNSGQNLGVAALITAIITFVIAVIPCLGVIAIIPGIIAIILASVGLSQASRSNSPRGLLVAGLVIGAIASLIAFSQIFVAGKIAGNAGDFPNNIETIINDIKDNVIREMDDENVNIKIESNGEVIEINAKRKDKVRVLEELEGDDSLQVEGADSLQDDTARTRQ